MFEKYTTEERKTLETAMIASALCGTPTPTTEEEIEKWCERTLKARAEAEKKEREKKERAEKKEREKAEAEGKTVEELKAEKKMQTKIKRYEREIRQLEEEIAKMEAEKAWRVEYLKKLKGEG